MSRAPKVLGPANLTDRRIVQTSSVSHAERCHSRSLLGSPTGTNKQRDTHWAGRAGKITPGGAEGK